MKSVKISFLALVVLALSACNLNFVYRPTTVKPHLFEKKGDFELGANLGMGNYAEMHGAYAIDDHFGIGAGYYTTSQIDTFYTFNDTNSYRTRNGKNEFEIHGVFFRNEEKNHIMEIQAGVAFATNRFTVKPISTTKLPDINAPIARNFSVYNRYFITPSYGKSSRNVDWAFSARIEYVDFKAYNDDVNFQPTFFVRYGFSNVKFMTQVGINTCPIYKSGTDYTPLMIGLGLNFTFNSHTKAKPKTTAPAKPLGYQMPLRF